VLSPTRSCWQIGRGSLAAIFEGMREIRQQADSLGLNVSCSVCSAAEHDLGAAIGELVHRYGMDRIGFAGWEYLFLLLFHQKWEQAKNVLTLIYICDIITKATTSYGLKQSSCRVFCL
jgi:hypothetical protein